jgi:hypothetical protein
MITINKQCVEDYTKYKEIEKQVKDLEETLKDLTPEHKDSADIFSADFLLIRMRYQELAIKGLYRSYKKIIDNALHEELNRLKEELNKFIIE